jgi:hypothetical protein
MLFQTGKLDPIMGTLGTDSLPSSRYVSLCGQVETKRCALVFLLGEAAMSSFGLLCDQIDEVPIISKQFYGRFG